MFCPDGLESLVAVSNNLIRIATQKGSNNHDFPVYEYYAWKLLTFESLMASSLWAFHPQFPMVKLTLPSVLRHQPPKIFPNDKSEITALKSHIPIIWEFASPDTYVINPWRELAPVTPTIDWEFLRPIIGWALCWKPSADAALLKGFYDLGEQATQLPSNAAMGAVARTVDAETKARIALKAKISSGEIGTKAEAKVAVEAEIGSRLGTRAFDRVWGGAAQMNPDITKPGRRATRRT